MTPADIKRHYLMFNPDGHFFDRKTMQFFGDTMGNFGVRGVTLRCYYDREGNYRAEGIDVPAWELYRKRPVKHGLQESHFFSRDNFRQTVGTVLEQA